MPIGILTLELHLASCASLKEKRGRLKPLITRIHREFNVSAAELDYLDSWQSALVGVAIISNSTIHNHKVLQKIIARFEKDWLDVELVDNHIELL